MWSMLAVLPFVKLNRLTFHDRARSTHRAVRSTVLDKVPLPASRARLLMRSMSRRLALLLPSCLGTGASIKGAGLNMAY